MIPGRWCPPLLGATVALGLLALGAARPPASCGCEIEQAATPPSQPTTQPGAHDPTIVKAGGKYYLFMTGRGIPTRVSTDLKTWGPEGHVFDPAPTWPEKEIPGFRGGFFWAPDVSRFGGKWHLYYSASTFGKNRSAIGHATNATLDPTRKDYQWVDEGPAFQSYPKDDYNAIDPNVVVDAKGTPWLSFGSFWGGLRLVKLDKAGHVADPGAKPLRIAQRPEPPDAIEASFIARHGGYYYLFASYDFCCRGANSTYNVRVGRSKDVRGPYLDRDGKAMTEGGGTGITHNGARWKGPGHEAVLHDGKTDYLAFHAYDTQNNGRPMLHVEKIAWDREGWPSVPPVE